MSHLAVLLLGPPRIELRNQPVEFSNRKVIALLAYLAASRQRHSRDSLATLLWPDSDQAKARAALRSVLWGVNKTLGPGWLEVERETVALAEAAGLAVDVEAFFQKLAACRGHGHPENEACPECLPLLAEAVQLYRGDFLGGFSLRDSPEFDDWQLFQSERLRRELGGALERLVQGQTAHGQFEAAITSAWRWLELDNLHEPAYRYLMLLSAWSGQAAAALRHYQEYGQLLDQELGVPPSAALTELYEAIKAGRVPAPPAVPSTGSPSTGSGGGLFASLPPVPSVPSPATEQRKQVTLLSLDLSEFTALAETLDPEEVSELMEALWQRFQAVVSAHSGHLDHDLGETITVLFGTPQAREDDPERAIRAALALQEEIRRFAGDRELLQIGPSDPLPQLRIGINTGPVLLKLSEASGTYSAVGGTLSLAGRLRQAAPPGEILISRHTYQHVRGLFELQPLDPLPARGRSEPVPLYRVQGVKLRAFRMQNRGVEGLETRMIGREGEFYRLQEAWEAALEDEEGQVVTIIGEAGVGKSRLLDEFSRWLELNGEIFYLLKGRADPQMNRLPYALIRDMLATRFGIQESDRLATAREKLERSMSGSLGPGQTEKVHFIGQLIGFDFSDSPHLAGLFDDARQLRDRAFQALVRFFEQITRKQPVAILLEDLHWADEGSVELIDHLGRLCHHLPLVIVGVGRPSFLERRPWWGQGQSFHTRLTLQPLSKRDSRRLVEEILRQAPKIPAELQELIVNNAEGNPFYMEELIKSLIEDGVIITGPDRWQVEKKRLARVRVPPTLVGVLQARLDRLPDLERGILQRGAIVGRVFWEGAVAHLQGKEAAPEPALPQALGALRRKEMIFARESSAFAGTQEYTFKHVILQEVTYESVLKRLRPRYHAQVARWLVEQGRERAEEYAGLIGEHFERAGETAQALAWYELAGRQAQKTYANETALLWYQRILELLAQLNPDAVLPFQQMRLSIHQVAGEVLTLVGRYDEALEHYTRAQAMIDREVGSAEKPVRQAGFCRRLAEIYEFQGNYEPAFQWLNRGLDHLSQTEASLETARLYRIGASLYFRQGNYEEAITWCQKSLAVASPFETPEAKQVLAETYYYLNAIYIRLGDFGLAIELCQKGIELHQQMGDLAGQAQGYSNLGVAFYHQGEWGRAIEAWQRCLTIRQEIGELRGQCHMFICLGVAQTDRGEWDQALQLLEQSCTLAQQIGVSNEEGLIWSNLAQVHLYRQDWAAAEGCLSRSQALFSEAGSLEFMAELERRWGEFYLKRGDLPQAVAHTQRSLEQAVTQGNPLEEGLTRRLFGQIYLVQGEHEAAKDALQHSLEILDPLNRCEAARTEFQLARLALAVAAPAEAQRRLASAIKTFEFFGAQADLIEARALEQ